MLTQIEKYVIAVANDERFHGIPAKWTFMAISNELDDFAKRKSNQRDKTKGLVYSDSDLPINVWGKTWAEIINDSRTRLDFINERLAYKADHDTSKDYIIKNLLKIYSQSKITGQSQFK